MHALEELRLYLDIEIEDPFPNAPLRIVTLPNLRMFCLGMNVMRVRGILAHLALPSASILVELVHEYADATLCNLAFSMAFACANTASKQLTYLRAMETANPSKEEKYYAGMIARCDKEEPTISISVVFRKPRHPAWVHEGLVQMALKAAPLEHVEELVVRSETDAWLDSLGSTPKLQSVFVEYNAAIALCAALSPRPDAVDADRDGNRDPPADDDAPRCFLPTLSTLTIGEVDFGILGEGGKTLAEALPLCLAERARYGCMLEVLDLSWSTVDEACVRVLEEAVPGMEI
ncbi:hypothetical protein FA95DRAFT_1611189, partial [Auriscalpium vulgare]